MRKNYCFAFSLHRDLFPIVSSSSYKSNQIKVIYYLKITGQRHLVILRWQRNTRWWRILRYPRNIRQQNLAGIFACGQKPNVRPVALCSIRTSGHDRILCDKDRRHLCQTISAVMGRYSRKNTAKIMLNILQKGGPSTRAAQSPLPRLCYFTT